MHPGRTYQRHERHHLLRRAKLAAATAASAVVLAGGTLLAGAPAARADSITVTPTAPLLYTFTQFSVSGTVTEPIGSDNDGFVDVAFNGGFVGSTAEDLDTGAFSGTFSVPQPGDESGGVPGCGANTVTVTTETDGGTSIPVGSVTITARCAGITVNPGVVGNQQLPATFHVTPQNFPLPGGFTLSVDGTPQNFSTATDGGLDITASPSCGTHQVVLSQTFNEQVISAAAQITVKCPQITLTPAAIPLASQPAVVLVTGSQFHASQPVTISVDGTAAGSGVTDAGGNFSLPVTARGLDCSAHQVTASEQPSTGGPAFLFSATATLQVTGCTKTLRIDPSVLQPGELTHVTGTGFAPGVPVTLTWQLPGGGPTLLGTKTVTAGSDGGVGAFFLVLPHDLLGARQLVATQGAAKLSADAIVDGGPMQPAAGGRLVYRR